MQAPQSRLERFGYSPAQATFLALVARHSGYFLRRQFRACVPRAAEPSLVDFIHAVVTARHAVPLHLDVDTVAYHLSGRALYGALDMPDHPNRRAHERTAVLQRLMALDLVLRYPMWRVLQDEADAVTFFTQARGVSADLLPATRYHHVRDVRRVTVRHFVGTGPIFIPSPDDVVFSYLDADDWTLGRFRAYIARHRRLWATLSGRPTVLFASTDAARVLQADRVWNRTMKTGTKARPLAEVQADCSARDRLEGGALVGLTQSDLDGLREAGRRVSGTQEAVYSAWRRGGEVAMRDVYNAAHRNGPQLETWHVPYRYGAPVHAWGRG